MRFNVMGLVALLLGVAVFIVAYACSRKRSVSMRVLVLAMASLLSIPSVLSVVYYLHVLPEYEWFYSLRAFPGSEFLIVFFAIACGCFSSFIPRLLVAIPLFAVLLVGSLPYIKPFLSPLDTAAIEDRWKGEACLQSTTSTCGPASVCSILKHYGIPCTEREVAEAAYSYSGGTEAWYLARFVRAKGLRPAFDLKSTSIPSDAVLPAVVGVRMGGMGHFIAVLSNVNGEVTFIDPLSGEEKLSEADFEKRYAFTGFRMSVRERDGS